jgi:hypothetical protein
MSPEGANLFKGCSAAVSGAEERSCHAASALAVLAVAVGTSLAIATRPVAPPDRHGHQARHLYQVKEAIADGRPRSEAQYLTTWVRNQNPRLRTLPMARNLRLDLLPGDCIESRNHQFAKLIKDSRAMSNSRPAYYFTLTVAGGAVHRIQEDKTFNAC